MIILILIFLILLFIRKRESFTQKPYQPRGRGFKRVFTTEEKLVHKYYPEFQPSASNTSNVHPKSVFFGSGQRSFAQNKSINLEKEKYKELRTNLKKLIDRKEIQVSTKQITTGSVQGSGKVSSLARGSEYMCRRMREHKDPLAYKNFNRLVITGPGNMKKEEKKKEKKVEIDSGPAKPGDRRPMVGLRLKFSKSEANKIGKEFVNKYNANSKNNVEFVKLGTLPKKNLILNKLRYVLTIFIKIPNFMHVFQILLVIEIDKKDFLQGKYDGKSLELLNNIVVCTLLGSSIHSDILFGSENTFETQPLIINTSGNYDKKGEYLWLPKKKEAERLVNEKFKKYGGKRYGLGYIMNVLKKKKSPTEYQKYDFDEGLIKIGEKCIDKYLGKNRWTVSNCDTAKQIFKHKDGKFKIDEENCLSYHGNGKLAYSSCDKTNCLTGDGLQNCNKFGFRKFGGVEIIGKEKCLKPNDDNTWGETDCYKAPKVKFLKKEKYQKIKNNTKGKIKIGDKCINKRNNKWVMEDCKTAKEFTYNNDRFKDDKECLTYHKSGKLGTSICDGKNYCSVNSKYAENCKNFKFLTGKGMEISGKNRCLTSNFGEIECDKAPIATFQ